MELKLLLCDVLSKQGTRVILGVLPLFLLAYWNYDIYKYRKIPHELIGKTDSIINRNNQENEMAKVLIGIVVIFICCHGIRIFLNAYNAFTLRHGTLESVLCMLLENYFGYPFWISILHEFKDLMLVINSSMNMIIYCYLNSNFRRNIFKCCKRCSWEIQGKESETKKRTNNSKKKEDRIIWNPTYDLNKSSIYQS